VSCEQLEAEKDELYQRKGAVELEKFGLREELVRVEQEKMDLDSEKAGTWQKSSVMLVMELRCELESS
jgi:hypothetical protein